MLSGLYDENIIVRELDAAVLRILGGNKVLKHLSNTV